jgi:hypothetical protein
VCMSLSVRVRLPVSVRVTVSMRVSVRVRAGRGQQRGYMCVHVCVVECMCVRLIDVDV